MTVAGVVPDWPAPMHVRAVVTERSGGVSVGRYSSLNLAAHVGDTRDAVHENRRLLMRGLELPSEPVWLDQVHGARIADLDSPLAGSADGAVTSRQGRVCAILTADCLPVLLTDRAGTRVGAAHAGWRGLVAGVLPAAVAAMGLPTRELLAWLGPAIGPSAYEVGDEVREAFLTADPAARAAFVANARGRWQADLYALARIGLAAAGVAAVFGGDFCTATEAERFFSHRREAPCGRMASLIWLDSNPMF